jgi:hypothetical protein
MHIKNKGPEPRFPRHQHGAAMLMVVIVFLIMLPIAIGMFMRHALTNTAEGVSAVVQTGASSVAEMALAQLRPQIESALNGGLLEYAQNKPAWFVSQPIDLRSDNFWQTCAAANTCVNTTISADSGASVLAFKVNEVVTPTGLVDPFICGEQGFVGVLYNLFIHVQPVNSPSISGSTIQSVYRACQKM